MEQPRGTILVISSPGNDYAEMKQAWTRNWRRQGQDGVRLFFLEGTSSPDDSELSTGMELKVDVPECLIPGVLDKTMAALRDLQGKGWVFRTNLSSHVDIPILCEVMESLPTTGVLGYSPGRDHICGAGMGIGEGTVRVLVENEGRLDRSVIDDVAISRLLFELEVPITWTGRLDRVYPDGLCRWGHGPYYHVRVKTRDRCKDADLLQSLAETGISQALSWFSCSHPENFLR